MVKLLLMVCAVLASAVFAGCGQDREKQAEEPLVIVDFDWRQWTTGEGLYGLGGPAFGGDSSFDEGYARHSYGVKAEMRTIHGSRYSQMRAFASPEPGNDWCFFTIAVGDIDDRDQRADIRLTTEVQCKLEITSFDQGILRNVDTGEVLTPPFILGPGEYHLEAVKAEDEAAKPTP